MAAPRMVRFEGDFRTEECSDALRELIEELWTARFGVASVPTVWPETVDGQPLDEWLGGGEVPETEPPASIQLDSTSCGMVADLTGEDFEDVWDERHAMNALAKEVRLRAGRNQLGDG
jgi:hypothetical protein